MKSCENELIFNTKERLLVSQKKIFRMVIKRIILEKQRCDGIFMI